jgi:hypothetical protein
MGDIELRLCAELAEAAKRPECEHRDDGEMIDNGKVNKGECDGPL